MKKKAYFTFLITLGLIFVMAGSCSQKADSRPNFVFKPSPSQGIAAEIAGQKISENELYKGVESEIFEAEMKVYEIKMNRLQAMAVEKFMEKDPRKKDLSHDEFLEKFIAKDISPSEKEVQDFIKERKIPKEHINAQMKERIRKFLEIEGKKEAIEKWLAQQTKDSPIMVYIPKPMRPTFDVNVGDAPSMGKENAKVTIVEFSDFQCPYCKKGADIVSQIKEKYGNKVRVAFKNFPLPFHNHAQKAAEAGFCAYEQSKNSFWKFHDKMFANQSKLDVDGLVSLAKEVGLDAAKFGNCLNSNKYAAKVQSDKEYGENLGVKSTPTFYVNGQLINGAQPFEVFSEIIEEELSK